jgi:hypothetical protein
MVNIKPLKLQIKERIIDSHIPFLRNCHFLLCACFLSLFGKVEEQGLQLIRQCYIPLHDILRSYISR